MKHDFKVFGAPSRDHAVCTACDLEFGDLGSHDDCPGDSGRHANRDAYRGEQERYLRALRHFRATGMKEKYAREQALISATA